MLFCLTLLPFTAKAEERIDIVVTSFHEFDWLSQIIKGKEDNFTVKLLLDSGIDLHNFQPKVRDIRLICSADLFIHNGGVSDTWANDILRNPENSKLLAFNSMKELGDAVKAEELVEGMQEDHSAHKHAHAEHEHCDHDHGHEAHNHEEHEAHNPHADEHVWLSLKNAQVLCKKLADTIAELDPANKEIYQKNAENYIAKLQELDKNFETEINALPQKTLIFTDRFPFLYMMKDYNIDYYAAFQGCSAETEASFETVSFLSKKADEHNAKALLIIDNGLRDLAQTVANTTKSAKPAILVLDSMQSVTKEERESGKSYLSMMQANLEVLKEALR